MNNINELFHRLTNIVSDSYITLFEPQQSIVIKENDPNADINRFVCIVQTASIEINTTFLDSFDNIFLNPIKKIYGDFNLRKKCDGVIIYSRDDTWFLMLVELKNKLTFTNFKRGLAQLESSNLKIKLIIDILDQIDVGKINSKFIFVSSLTRDHEYQEEKFLFSKRDLIQQNPQESKLFAHYKSIIENREIQISELKTNCCELYIKPKLKIHGTTITLFQGSNLIETF